MMKVSSFIRFQVSSLSSWGARYTASFCVGVAMATCVICHSEPRRIFLESFLRTTGRRKVKKSALGFVDQLRFISAGLNFFRILFFFSFRTQVSQELN
jgi:hypothetical protein